MPDKTHFNRDWWWTLAAVVVIVIELPLLAAVVS